MRPFPRLLWSLLALLALVACLACSPKSKTQPSGPVLHANATPVLTPPNPVYLADGVTSGAYPMGVAGNPLVATITCDAGNCQVAVVGPVSVVFDAAAATVGIAGTVPVDTVPGDLTNTVTHFVAGTSAGLFKVDAGPGTFVGANFCNVGTIAGYFQVFFGQTLLDAGGTADAGTVPSLVTVYLTAGQCASLNEVQAFYDGGAWYSSSTQPLLTIDAGVPNLSVDIIQR